MLTEILHSLVLMVAFQFSEYSTLETDDLTVCLTVTSGMLAPNVMVSATLGTLPGNAVGKSMNNVTT